MVVGLMDVGMIQATVIYEQNDVEYCKLKAAVCKVSSKALRQTAILYGINWSYYVD